MSSFKITVNAIWLKILNTTVCFSISKIVTHQPLILSIMQVKGHYNRKSKIKL